MKDACQRYAEDPEKNAAHLQECAECREIYGALAAEIEANPMNVEALPFAPWEGASHRAWPLVIGGALAVLAIALALCAAAGISPFLAIAMGARPDAARAAIAAIDEKLRPLGPVVFTALFIVVNSILVFLLRRAPRGIDA